MIPCSIICMTVLCVWFSLPIANSFISISSTTLTSSSLPLCLPFLLQNQPKSNEEYDMQINPLDTLQISSNNNQSLVPDIAYYYLKKTIGLHEETMWKITLEAGSILGMTPANLEKKISLLIRTMDLSDEDIREILGKQPAVLHLSADRNLAPTILLLVRALDLSKSELRSIIMTCPSILGYSLDNLKKKLSFFMDTLGFNLEDDGKGKVRDMFLLEPKLLSCGVKSGLVPRMQFLHREIQFTLNDLRTLYQKNPKLLVYSLDNNLREKIVFFFILQLQMELEHVRKMLLSYPNLMNHNLESHMKPIAEYFVMELEFSATELRSIMMRFPRLFTHSMYKVKHIVGFLRYELALDAQQVKRVIFQVPQIIGLDTECNLKNKLNFLQDRIGLSQQELAVFIAKMPTIFSLNVETSLIPKFDYLERCLNTTVELKSALQKQPVLLGYSLDRIQSRMEQLVKAGIAPNKITVGISMTEGNFQKWLFSSLSRLELSKWNSAAMTYLCKRQNFTDRDIDTLCNKLPHIITSSVTQMRSQISYLERIFEGEDLKNLILQYPTLVDVSQTSRVRRRLNYLHLQGIPLVDNLWSLSWDNDQELIPFIDSTVNSEMERLEILSLPPLECEKKLFRLYLYKRNNFTSQEADILLQTIFTMRPFLTKCVKKIDYLLNEVFHNNSKDLRQALLNNPLVLRKSLNNTIIPRVETLQYLKSLEIEYSPCEVGKLLSLSPPKYEKALVPVMKTWGGPTIEDGDQFSGDDIRAALRDYAPRLVCANSLDFNRESAKIVYWS